MHDDHAARLTLTPTQWTTVDFARRDLEYARSEDLAHLGEAGLILLIEKLRGRLGDALQVVDELAMEPPQ
ncbi:hypothetical protein [Streptomyces regalis]|uniref:Uncharacterized protein n=1 Tax=Streptomyces regalis TaxID=68262 RepID=A0A124G8Q0_9ACTN|nr:hypothetical protein [Streptomyces regalis]KUL26620.1 hypothetical protein ADL12_32190 [Streptomyces regalis]